ncbi:hypothetical protein PIB30_087772, partial [Stylosanthes scabra]|nr:hypothetical protein [Stylosanthes scabra]
MARDSPSSNNLDAYLASSTIITFDRFIPLFHGPYCSSIRPSVVLVFCDARAWAFISCVLGPSHPSHTHHVVLRTNASLHDGRYK